MVTMDPNEAAPYEKEDRVLYEHKPMQHVRVSWHPQMPDFVALWQDNDDDTADLVTLHVKQVADVIRALQAFVVAHAGQSKC